MGNRAIITLEDQDGHNHPVALQLQWNGGLESVLAFATFTWESFDRGHGDLYTFHARLCQVIGNFFPDGLSLYGYPVSQADEIAGWCDHGRFHFRIGKKSFELIGRADEIAAAKTHAYWSESPSILDSIAAHMPARKGGAK